MEVCELLGFWNKGTNYGGMNPLSGEAVYNSDFRDYRNSRGKGHDFKVYSNVKVENLKETFKVKVQR